MPILLSFRDLTRDSKTTDRRDDRFIRLLHLQCVSLILIARYMANSKSCECKRA